MPDGGSVAIASAVANAVAAVTGSAAAAGAAYGAAAFATSFKGALLLGSALSSVAAGAARKVPDPGTEVELSVNSDEPRRWVVGKRMIAGSIADRVAFDSVGGDKFDTHALVIVLADHRINSLMRVMGDGLEVHGSLEHGVRTPLTAYNDDDVGGAVGRNRVWMTFYDGRAGAPADPNLIAKTTGFNVIGRWTTAHKLAGLAYVIVEMKYDDDSMTQYPSWLFEIEGARLYDRRKDTTAGGSGSHRLDDPSTWEYSTNAAVARDHYRQGVIHNNGRRMFGPGDDPEVDPYDDFEARADLCDETVSLKSGGSQKKYEFNGVVTADANYADVFERFAVQMGGEDADDNGRAIVIPGEVKTPVLTLYDGDVAELATTGYSDKKSRSEKVTAVEGRYSDPSQLYQSVDYPRIENPDWVTADGERPRVLPLELPDEISVERAQRLATLVANRARREGVIAEEFLINAPAGGVSPLKLEIGDWFVRKSDFHGFDEDGKEFEVIDAAYDHEAGTVSILGREVDPSDLAWTASDAKDPPAPPPPDHDPGLIPVDTPSVSAEGVSVTGDNSSVPGVEITVTNLDERRDRIIAEIEKSDGAGGWIEARVIGINPETGVRTTTDGIVESATYRVRAKVYVGDQESEWSDYDTTASPDDWTVPDLTEGGPGRERMRELQEEADRAAEALIEDVLDRRERIIENWDRTLGIKATLEEEIEIVEGDLEASITLSETYRTQTDTALAGLENDITVVASNLGAEVTTRTTQYAATQSAFALAETERTTIASDLSSLSSEVDTFAATFNSSLAALEDEITVVADDLSAEVTARTTAVAAVEEDTATLFSQVGLVVDDQEALAEDFTTIEADFGGLEASVTDLSLAVSTLEEQSATRIIEVEASGNKAGIQIEASSGGSHLHQYGQKWSYGKNFASESVVHDPNAGVGGQTTYRASDGTVTHRIDWNTGIIRSYNTSGDEWWNNVSGSVYASLPDDVKTQLGEDDGDANITSVSNAWTTLATVNLGTVPGTGVISADGKINVLTNATTGAAVGGEYRVQYKLGAGAWTDLLDGDWRTEEIQIDDGGGGSMTRYTSYYGSYAGSKAAPGAGTLQFRLQVYKPGSTGNFTSEGTMTAKRSP
ncbi:hypothetical protein [Euryhalocaulis caribicus]|uniref:hypothetical protein n=1 Tax=Euryhalocaulis caribicus TaxID=1161401 RepID=UPI00039BA4FD|nr:hypothetical protein [Euryhalocaulis caribicus]